MRQSEVNDTPRKWLPPCDNTSLENSGWKSWTNACVSPAIIYGPLQLCKYQCWATFLTANDGLGFGIIMTDQRWIIHPRALKYAITLQLLRIHPSWHSATGLKKAAQHNSAVINCYGPSCVAVVVVFFRLWKAKIDRQQENNKAGKYPKLGNFPFIEKSSVLTPDLCTAEPGRKHFPKHNQSIVKQRKIIPRRNLMARLLNVSLFCQQEISPPTILWKSSHDVCFIAVCHESKVDLSRRQNSKAFWSGHDWIKSLLMSLGVINYPSLTLAEGRFIPFPLLLKLRPVFGIEMSSRLSWTCNL